LADPTELQRVYFPLHVRPDRVDQYCQGHEDVWPKMRSALQSAGWHNHSLFRDGVGTVIGYSNALASSIPVTQ